ncbi:MAG: hypothetical protein ACOY93_02270 [Bacillota bacterium]
MNRAISGVVAFEETDQPLPGLLLLAGRLQPEGIEWLGWTVSGPGGRFRIDYPPLEEAPDLVLFCCDPDGRLLYVEPPHRSIAGAELRLAVKIPRDCIS